MALIPYTEMREVSCYDYFKERVNDILALSDDAFNLGWSVKDDGFYRIFMKHIYFSKEETLETLAKIASELNIEIEWSHSHHGLYIKKNKS